LVQHCDYLFCGTKNINYWIFKLNPLQPETDAMPEGKRLSDVEQHALLAVWRLGDLAWGANIRDELAEVTGRKLSISAVYVTLVRLEKSGLVTSGFSEPEKVRGGKAKRCFQIAEPGIAALKDSRAQLDRLWSGLDAASEGRQ
jgi:DNA-binding PadR family transcriptional regulator